MTGVKEQFQHLRSFYRGDFSYYLLITSAAFFTVCLGSFVIGMWIPSFSDGFVNSFLKLVSGLGGTVQDLSSIQASVLFANNLRATIVSIVYGLLPFIYLPALSLGINAALVGTMAAYYAHNGQSLWLYLLGIVPHGTFELPALLLSLACGFYLCRCSTVSLRRRERGVMKPALLECGRVLLLQITPLLLLASVVEAHITPYLLKLFS